jgi:hypothetical protein
MKLSIISVCLLLTVTNGFQPIVAIKKVMEKTPVKPVTKSPAAPAKVVPVVPSKKVTPVAPPKKK